MLRFAVFGAGPWARYQLSGWREIEGVECVALYNRTRQKAAVLAEEFGITRVYDDPVKLVDSETLDFMDVITDIGTHSRFVQLGAERGIPVICQEPMAPTLETAESMAAHCRDAGIPLYIHENWRWQRPMREVKRILDSGAIGDVGRAEISLKAGAHAFPTRQQYRDSAHFILMEMGSHILDTARYLFGEAESPACQLHTQNCVEVQLHLGASRVLCALEYVESIPSANTTVIAHGELGTLELFENFEIRIRRGDSVEVVDAAPQRYTWSEPALEVIHASIVPCGRDLIAGLRGEAIPETTAEDNLKTMRLVTAAMDSARQAPLVRAS